MAMKARRRAPVPNQVEVPEPDGGVASYTGTFTFEATYSTRAVRVQPVRFSICPICLSDDRLTAEHVPMSAIGGSVMTYTCQACNNILGSHSEEELRKAFHAEVPVEAESTGESALKGTRRASGYLRRSALRDPIVFVETSHPEFSSLLAVDGPTNLRYRLLDPFLVEIALLKYSYLAACMWLEAVPATKSADAVRRTLLAVRDGQAVDVREVPADVPRVWPFHRIENATFADGIFLLEPIANAPQWMFVMAGTLAVRWPFADISPTGDAPISVEMPVTAQTNRSRGTTNVV